MWLWVRLLWFNEWCSWFSVTRILPREFKDTLRLTHIRVMCKPSLMDDEVDGCCGGGWLLVGGSGSGSSGTSDQHRLIIIVVGVYFWWLNRSRNPQQQIPNTHEIATWRSCWENTNRGTAKGLIVSLHCAPSGLFFVANCYNVIIFRLHVLYIYLCMRLRVNMNPRVRCLLLLLLFIVELFAKACYVFYPLVSLCGMMVNNTIKDITLDGAW